MKSLLICTTSEYEAEIMKKYSKMLSHPLQPVIVKNIILLQVENQKWVQRKKELGGKTPSCVIGNIIIIMNSFE